MPGKQFSVTTMQKDGMTVFGWEKHAARGWADMLDGRRFDCKNKPISRRTASNRRSKKLAARRRSSAIRSVT